MGVCVGVGVSGIRIASCGGSRPRLFVRRAVRAQLLGACVVPFLDGGVGDAGEGGGGEVGREALACLRVQDGEVEDGALEKGNVFGGVEEGFDGLPAHEASESEGGDRRGIEVARGRLEGVLAADGLVDE